MKNHQLKELIKKQLIKLYEADSLPGKGVNNHPHLKCRCPKGNTMDPNADGGCSTNCCGIGAVIC